MMELTDGRKAKEERKFPKNIRQIGEPGDGRKVYVEDYAYTFLRQFAEENLTCAQAAILIGQALDSGIYIQGALAVDMGQDMGRWFSHEHWRNIFQEVQSWFEGKEVVGWFLANPGFPTALTDELRSLHLRNFSGEEYVFFQMDVIENEETFYGYTDRGLAPLSGYYIYYEKNECMQAYISQRKGGIGIEPEGILRDRAAARFRNVMQEKKEQTSQKKTMAFLYTACTFLVMVILVIGITMVNNYDRMADMENAIYHISESLSGDEIQPEEKQLEEEPSEEEPLEEETSEGNPSEEEQSLEEEQQEEEVQEEDVQEEVQEEDVQEEVQEEEAQPVMSQAVVEPEPYQVKVGDTLLQISRSRYGTEDMVSKICEVNDLDDENKIYVGQTILLP